MKFIGHLDLLKLFQRAIKRANLPISYSKGFNPHQLVSFAIPLSLGMASSAEYVDIQLDKKVDCEAILKNLNGSLPEGMKVLNVRELAEGEKTGAAIIEAAKYEIIFDEKVVNLEQNIENILAKREIMVEKTGKKETKSVDIRNDIFSVLVNEDRNGIIALISTGSKNNLKPEHLVSALGYEYKLNKCTRLEMYKKVDGDFIAL